MAHVNCVGNRLRSYGPMASYSWRFITSSLSVRVDLIPWKMQWPYVPIVTGSAITENMRLGFPCGFERTLLDFPGACDAQPSSTVLLVLSCGPEWGGAGLGHE